MSLEIRLPELPEVETVKNGLLPHVEHAVIQDVIVRQHQLRWPVPLSLHSTLQQKQVISLSRRGKYLLMQFDTGTLIIHLGMSGSLRMVNKTTPVVAHDHVDIIFTNENILRYNDPRRFGALLWTDEPPLQHVLLKSLGPEPMESTFSATYLSHRAKNRTIPVKSFIMDSKIVVGIGNIYAAEALFTAKIHPLTPAGSLTFSQLQKLVHAIKQVLQAAIAEGGTTIRNFINSEGKPGYFVQQLAVYGRAGRPCIDCGAVLHELKLAQRSTVFCKTCQQTLSNSNKNS